MTKHSLHRQRLCAAISTCTLFAVAAGISVQAQNALPKSVSAGATNATGTTAPAYEVVSIRPSKSESGNGSWQTLPDGYRITNMPLLSLVYSAYGITMESQISGLPGWVKTDPYDIEAKVDADTAEAWKKLTWKERSKQEQPMLQSLLADRFQFKAHEETKQLPVYDFVIAKGGLKMKQASADEKTFYTWNGGSSGFTFTARATSVQSLATSLSGSIGRIIVDKTGLGDKKFDFELKWTPDLQRATDAIDAGPSIFTALEEQLGLKLVPSKGPVQVLVIDHMERPSPN